MIKKKQTVFIVMGVSGTGKSTIGKLLSKKLKIPFFDGDDFHPDANIKKMASGNPLNDDDRYDWLVALNQLAKDHKSSGAVIACSSLKSSYRNVLRKNIKSSLVFIYLEGTFELIKSRLEKRSSHFMPIDLLKSQFEILEPPTDTIKVSIALSPEEIIESVSNHIES